LTTRGNFEFEEVVMNKSQGRRSFSNVGINSPSFLWLYLNILHFFLLYFLSWKWKDICFSFFQQSWLFSTNIFCATVFPRSVNFISIEYLLPTQKVDLDFLFSLFCLFFILYWPNELYKKILCPSSHLHDLY